MRCFRQLYKKILSLVFGVWLLLFPALTSAQLPGVPAWNSDCYYTFDGQKIATIKGFECLFARFLAIAISIIGVIVLVMIVIGAYHMLFSGGEAKNVETARNTITFAILGLILAISSWFIINLIASITGAEGIRIFKIGV